MQGCTNPGRHIAQATTCTAAPNICWPSVWNLPHVTFLAPGILRFAPKFLENLETHGSRLCGNGLSLGCPALFGYRRHAKVYGWEDRCGFFGGLLETRFLLCISHDLLHDGPPYLQHAVGMLQLLLFSIQHYPYWVGRYCKTVFISLHFPG